MLVKKDQKFSTAFPPSTSQLENGMSTTWEKNEGGKISFFGLRRYLNFSLNEIVLRPRRVTRGKL